MRLYLGAPHAQLHPGQLRRDRSANGRKFLTFEDGSRSYFPSRAADHGAVHDRRQEPRRPVRAPLRARRRGRDQPTCTCRATASATTSRATPHEPPTTNEAKILDDLCRAGKRLMGFCRTNLFKRLESSGTPSCTRSSGTSSATTSILHAIENDLPLPIGSQDAELLDSRINDEDDEMQTSTAERCSTRTKKEGVRRTLRHHGICATEDDFPPTRRRDLQRLCEAH